MAGKQYLEAVKGEQYNLSLGVEESTAATRVDREEF